MCEKCVEKIKNGEAVEIRNPLEYALLALTQAAKALSCPDGEFANFVDLLKNKQPDIIQEIGPDDDRKNQRIKFAAGCIHIAGSTISELNRIGNEMMGQLREEMGGGPKEKKSEEPAQAFGFGIHTKKGIA